MATAIVLRPGELSLGQLREVARGGALVTLDPKARTAIDDSRRIVESFVAEQRTAYGINTGFGRLANTRIEADRLAQLQTNIVLSHSTGTGPLLDDTTVRLVMALKIASLARGFSGISWPVVEALTKLLEQRVYPCIPAKGSVGASGDLAPLAHLAAVLLGVGSVRHDGQIRPAEEGLAISGLAPMVLGPKEGLALLNGTQVSTALALEGLFAAEDVFAAAVVAGSLSVDAAKGSDVPFDPRIHAVRGHPGQSDIARIYRTLLEGSTIRQSHLDCTRVQDPYSLRCQPQVMGACLDQLRYACQVLLREANAVTDNPLVFPDEGEVLSGGNFHGEPVALAADAIAVVIAEIGALSERRTALLMDPAMSGLPAFLVQEGGVNSGFMIAQVTAAALASENKTLAHPASVDSLPTSANQEDHVSMATFAARRLLEMADNTAGVVAIELLAAAQGIEFHRPMRSSPPLEQAIDRIRAQVAFWDADRYFAPDIEKAKSIVVQGTFSGLLSDVLPSL
jgi:histidine ammonia-lyase